MADTEDKMLKAISIYSAASIISSAIPFLLIPILTRYMEPWEYGMVSMVVALIAAGGIFNLSLNGALTRVYLKNEYEFKSYFASVLLIYIISFIVLGVLLVLFKSYVSQYTKIPEIWLYLVLSLVFFKFFQMAYLAICLAAERVKEYAGFQITQAVIVALLSIVFVVVINWGWEGRVYAMLATSILLFLYIIFQIKRNNWINLRPNNDYINDSLRFGVGLLPYQIGGFLMMYSDRLFLGGMVSAHELGLYAFALQLSMAFSLFVESINKAYVPWLYKKLNDITDKEKVWLVKMIYSSFVGFILLGLFIYAILKILLPYIGGGEYIEAQKFLLVLVLSVAVSGMQNMVANIIFYTNKTHFLGLSAIVGGCINIAAIPFFIEIYGSIGVAYALLLTKVVMFFLTWVGSIKAYNLPWMKLKHYD